MHRPQPDRPHHRGGPYHPRAAHVRRREERLHVKDATAMAVGGMIGGGIFSVLGVAITLAGHLAAGCFVLGGVLAAVTARSWAGVASRSASGRSPFDHLRAEGHEQLAGVLVWLLIFGYMVAMAVYSFTFGRYAANALDAGTGVARLLSVTVVALFLGVNMRGVRVSSLTEDLVVATKLVILFGVAIIGISRFDTSRLTPLASSGVGGMFLGAATVFFAYEGFELICYDRADMVDPDRTLARSLYLSVAIVAAVYIGVTLGAQMLVSDDKIVSKKEAAFVEVGKAALGGFGRWAAIAGAVFATGSAINATLFSTARLMRDASGSGELPATLAREHRGLPVISLACIAAAGAAMAMLPGITSVIAFGSGSFLAVYAIVNYLEARQAASRSRRVVAWIAAVACVAALGDLVVDLARHDRPGLALLLGLVGALAAARAAFVRRRRLGRRALAQGHNGPHVSARLPAR